jgi:hypothetical protein
MSGHRPFTINKVFIVLFTNAPHINTLVLLRNMVGTTSSQDDTAAAVALSGSTGSWWWSHRSEVRMHLDVRQVILLAKTSLTDLVTDRI